MADTAVPYSGCNILLYVAHAEGHRHGCAAIHLIYTHYADLSCRGPPPFYFDKPSFDNGELMPMTALRENPSGLLDNAQRLHLLVEITTTDAPVHVRSWQGFCLDSFRPKLSDIL